MNNDKKYTGVEGPEFFCVLYENFYPEIPGSKKLMKDDGTVIKETDNVQFTYTFFDYYEQFYKGSYLDSINVPHMIYTGCGTIPQLENRNLTDVEINLFNQRGLHIFLYENLNFFKGNKKSFYIESSTFEKYERKEFDFQYETENIDYEFFYSFELDSINEFVKRNNLTSVTVFACDFKINKKFKEKYNLFNIKCKDIFLISLFEKVEDIPCPAEHNPQLENYFSYDTIEYKFWSGNWRYDTYRHLIVLYLADKSAKFSWSYSTSINETKNRFWFDIENWKNLPIYDTIVKNDRIITLNAPYQLDISVNQSVDVDDTEIFVVPDNDVLDPPNGKKIPVDIFSQCFCSVVTESLFTHPFANITEKTLMSIKAMRPFVLVAPPGSLEYIKQLGFKTFDSIWDESYDREMNHEKRLLKIFNLLDYINNMDISRLRELYQTINPILKHNYNILNSFRYNGEIYE